MAKETQKQQIERLEKELWEQKVLCSKLNREIIDMQDKAEDSFINSPTYQQFIKKIETLEVKVKHYERMANHEALMRENAINNKPHNERGAGRKARFTEQEKETMKMYKIQGKSFKEIAEMFKCSVGLVHKLINEQ